MDTKSGSENEKIEVKRFKFKMSNTVKMFPIILWDGYVDKGTFILWNVYTYLYLSFTSPVVDKTSTTTLAHEEIMKGKTPRVVTRTPHLNLSTNKYQNPLKNNFPYFLHPYVKFYDKTFSYHT